MCSHRPGHGPCRVPRSGGGGSGRGRSDRRRDQDESMPGTSHDVAPPRRPRLRAPGQPRAPGGGPSVLTSGHAAWLPRPQHFVIRLRAGPIIRASGRASQAARAGQEMRVPQRRLGSRRRRRSRCSAPQPGAIIDVSARGSLLWPGCLVGELRRDLRGRRRRGWRRIAWVRGLRGLPDSAIASRHRRRLAGLHSDPHTARDRRRAHGRIHVSRSRLTAWKIGLIAALPPTATCQRAGNAFYPDADAHPARRGQPLIQLWLMARGRRLAATTGGAHHPVSSGMCDRGLVPTR